MESRLPPDRSLEWAGPLLLPEDSSFSRVPGGTVTPASPDRSLQEKGL